MKLRRLGSIVVKELRQLRRDRLTFAMIIGIPTMQLVLFGYAINMDVRHLDAAVLDRIATVLGVNLVMKQDTNDTVDLDFKEASLEDAISYFPPSVHVHVRKDIQRISTVPLLVELAN